MNNCDINQVEVSGHVMDEPCRSHTSYGADFYYFSIAVKRLSGQADILPVIISDRLFDAAEIYKGAHIALEGQLRSYNEYNEGKPHLRLRLFVKSINLGVPEVDQNEMLLEGYLCKAPIYRVTPFGREIADLLIAVNRQFNKADYIPIIVWGKNARFAKTLEVGQKLRIEGRFQSREYEKALPDGMVDVRTAYEVSASSIYLVL